MRKTKKIIVGMLLLIFALTTVLWIGCEKQSVTNPTEATQSEIALAKFGRNITEVMDIQNRHTDRLLQISGVVGTATAKSSDGRYAIKILTQQAGLERKLPRQIENIPVEIEVVGEIKAQDVYTDRYRPVPCGVSGGSFEYYRDRLYFYVYDGGTIGCIVRQGNTKYFLSCNHVFAHSNKEAIGTPIVQPALIDVGGVQNPADIIGYLSDFKPIKWGAIRNTNDIDAAIAEIAPGIDYTCDMICGYSPSSSPVEATLGMAVKKCGRTTGYTEGEVIGVNVTVVVNYMPDGYARYDNQIEFTRITDSGDSGSLAVTMDGNHPVALLFAGSSSHSIGNPIQAVLDYFGVSICGN